MNAPIIVWRWRDAPNSLKTLSEHGGDEDWVALIPPHMVNSSIPWMEEGTSFGFCDVSSHVITEDDEDELLDVVGYEVRIGAHA